MEQKNKPKNITMIEMDAELPNLGKLIATPRFGITVIGSKLAEAGHNVNVFSESYINKISLDDVLEDNPDIVMFNGMEASIDNVKKMAQKIKQNLPNIPIIVGGEEATMRPERVQRFADYIVLNEGDNTILNLVDTLENKGDISKIKGIMYKENEQWVETEQADRIKDINYKLRPEIFNGAKNIGKRFLARTFGLSNKLKVLSFPIQTSRGCIYECSFCTQEKLFGGKGYVIRSIDDAIEDIDSVMKYNGSNHFMIVDNLFGGNKKKTIEFLKKIKNKYSGKKIKPQFSVLMRADQFSEKGFTDSEMYLMKQAGINNVSIGMESINEDTLKRIKPGANLKIYINVLKRLKKHKIKVKATFGVGGGEDTKNDVKAIGEFAKNYGIDAINLYSFGIVPGTKEYETNPHLAIQRVPNKYMNGHATTILPKKMLPSELQEGIHQTMNDFYSWRSGEGAFYKMNLRKIRKSLRPYLERLKELESDLIEKGIYDMNTETGNWELNEDLLKTNPVSYK